MSLYVEKGPKKIILSPASGKNKFLLPPLDGDSVRLSVEYKGQKIVFGKMPAWYFVHGATVEFGRISRVHMKITDERETLQQEVLRALNLAQWLKDKKVKGVRFCRIVPRVYGDGTVQLIYEPV